MANVLEAELTLGMAAQLSGALSVGCGHRRARKGWGLHLRQCSRCGMESPETGRTLQRWQSSLQTSPMTCCHGVTRTQTAQSADKDPRRQQHRVSTWEEYRRRWPCGQDLLLYHWEMGEPGFPSYITIQLHGAYNRKSKNFHGEFTTHVTAPGLHASSTLLA